MQGDFTLNCTHGLHPRKSASFCVRSGWGGGEVLITVTDAASPQLSDGIVTSGCWALEVFHSQGFVGTLKAAKQS